MTQLPGYPCALCGRQSRGFAMTHPNLGFNQFCSQECLVAFTKHDPATTDERSAALAGGDKGGAYLDEIGKTDLAKLSPDEWAEFCSRIYIGACDKLRADAEDEIPF